MSGDNSSSSKLVRGRHAVRVIAVIAVPLLSILVLPVSKIRQCRVHLKTCLQNADALRNGAAVRISGVEVGRVRRVEVRPEDHACPVFVEMELQSSYQLKVPRDSKAYISTAGILGPTYVGIDSSDAFGIPIEDWGTLQSKVVSEIKADDLVRRIERVTEESTKEHTNDRTRPSVRK